MRKRKRLETERWRGGGGGAGGGHIARLQVVNNLEEHWGDETKMNTKHWQRLTWSCSYISAYHRALPLTLPPPPRFHSSLSLYLCEEPPPASGRKQLCGVLAPPHVLRNNRMSDNCVPGNLPLPPAPGGTRVSRVLRLPPGCRWRTHPQWFHQVRGQRPDGALH